MKKPKEFLKEHTDDDQFKEYMVSGLTLVSAIVVRRLIKYLWKVSTNTEPPENPASRNVSWKEAFLFTVLTGIMVSVTKLLIRRNVAVGLEEHY
ncbi:DUF4235 domain-containing protein [Porifericola rhodea]|uniref:DUF4235 domain-containing protein n=1 Tax=Porifericola rhodea TaxID=930972 RepID=UPI0026667E08|nr:DUF4235 domain-containing protein [Porifericola rhodea]WKN31554.1 DUF4235 domain-containing protein [Porifericola rhodea]